MSSVAGVVGLKHCGAYGASKFAVEGLSLAVAEEVERFGIKVTVVEPGFFRTDLLDGANVKWPSKRIDDYAGDRGQRQGHVVGLRWQAAGRSRQARPGAREARGHGDSAAAVRGGG